MARELAGVYSQVYNLALEASLLSFTDPADINFQSLTLNKTKLQKLHACLFPLLETQHDIETSCLSLELQHLLKNTLSLLTRLELCLTKKLPSEKYFTELHGQGACQLHRDFMLEYWGGSINISLALINDIEILFKRINCIFYCLPAHNTVTFLKSVMAFLGQLRKTSPVPDLHIYLSSVPCLQCFKECAVLPNQGENVFAMLAEKYCGHVCPPVKPEPVIGQCENEMKQLGILGVQGSLPQNQTIEEEVQVHEASLEILNNHTIFEKVSETVAELSNLVYWNTGQRKLDVPDLSSEMAQLMIHDAKLHKAREKVHRLLGHKTTPTHYFDVFQPEPLESLFCGGVFYSLTDTITALKKDCSATYLKKANYQSIIRKQNELFIRLNMLFQRSKTDTEDTNVQAQVTLEPTRQATKEQVWLDAQARKDTYIKKVTKDGLKKLYSCLESQSTLLTNTLCLRVWGAVIYEEAATLINHFLFKKQFISLHWHDNSQNCATLYENSKYIKNSLYSYQLSKEHIDALTLQFYKLLIGPLFQCPTLFPLPNNVILAHCLDAAGVMPHQKIQLTELIWPTIEPKEWIEAEFNNFYNINAPNLNKVQLNVWRYIREVVLSVALYNRVWEKDLQIHCLCDFTQNCLTKSAVDFPDGLYLTYEVGKPLVFVHRENGWIFKDLYSLLYSHLQLTSDRQGSSL